MPRWLCDIELDGSRYSGTAVQPGLETLQGHLQDIASELEGEPRRFRMAGRLDVGVAAAGLPVQVDLTKEWTAQALGRAFNGHLERPLAAAVVRRVASVPDDFDLMKDVAHKTYRYRVWHSGHRSVRDPQSHWLRRIRHPDWLQPLAEILVGTQDCSGFACLRGDASDESDPVRTISAAQWSETPVDGGIVRDFCITGTGFLYKQVRGIVGALLYLVNQDGTLDAACEAVRSTIVGGRQAERIGQIAPSRGLLLQQVELAKPTQREWI